jgi:hypothetical protein
MPLDEPVTRAHSQGPLDICGLILQSEQDARGSSLELPSVAKKPSGGVIYRLQVGEKEFRVSKKTIEKAPRGSRLRETVEVLDRFVTGMVEALLGGAASSQRSDVKQHSPK